MGAAERCSQRAAMGAWAGSELTGMSVTQREAFVKQGADREESWAFG
jgi:hypothetical protein